MLGKGCFRLRPNKESFCPESYCQNYELLELDFSMAVKLYELCIIATSLTINHFFPVCKKNC